MFMYKEIVLLTTLILTGSSWLLRSTHISVVPNLTVRCQCEHSENSECNMDHLMRIRVLKQNDAGNWTTFAEISEPNNLIVKLSQCLNKDIVASGHLSTPGESFLSVTWTTASDETVGSYQCQVDGFGEDFRSDVHLSTQTVNITSFLPTTTDPVKIQSTVEDNNPLEVRFWPQGEYFLLSPDSGCPDTPCTMMVRSSVNITTETDYNPNNRLSSASHLHPDVFGRHGNRNDFYFRFCRSPVSNGQVVSWPNGSYCINYHYWGGRCPPGFAAGGIVVYLESSTSIIGSISKNGDPIFTNSDYITISFCCRNDGDPNVPVLLPTNKPFYLYRYKGKCQEVKNMDVSDEWIQLDSSSQDGFSYKIPDSELDDFTLQLCYYTNGK